MGGASAAHSSASMSNQLNSARSAPAEVLPAIVAGEGARGGVERAIPPFTIAIPSRCPGLQRYGHCSGGGIDGGADVVLVAVVRHQVRPGICEARLSNIGAYEGIVGLDNRRIV